MIVLAVLGALVCVITLERWWYPNHSEAWHILMLWLSFGATALVLNISGQYTWQRAVLTGFGIWGGVEFARVLYHTLLAAGDLCRLIVQRNTQRR